ncbi:hypothetical protein OSB04_027552 [Centaurea solstitialis]|uniref:Uncharacterized protein n=1 Tax=Centaurea solstitialis TaxID=347529 RepID=A0AA38SR26_9ASTR|nr:hypothetical protein OSB04_027552 [Centaurea solstitialis]
MFHIVGCNIRNARNVVIVDSFVLIVRGPETDSRSKIYGQKRRERDSESLEKLEAIEVSSEVAMVQLKWWLRELHKVLPVRERIRNEVPEFTSSVSMDKIRKDGVKELRVGLLVARNEKGCCKVTEEVFEMFKGEVKTRGLLKLSRIRFPEKRRERDSESLEKLEAIEVSSEVAMVQLKWWLRELHKVLPVRERIRSEVPGFASSVSMDKIRKDGVKGTKGGTLWQPGPEAYGESCGEITRKFTWALYNVNEFTPEIT